MVYIYIWVYIIYILFDVLEYWSDDVTLHFFRTRLCYHATKRTKTEGNMRQRKPSFITEWSIMATNCIVLQKSMVYANSRHDLDKSRFWCTYNSRVAVNCEVCQVTNANVTKLWVYKFVHLLFYNVFLFYPIHFEMYVTESLAVRC